jgi:hypothetical protein
MKIKELFGEKISELIGEDSDKIYDGLGKLVEKAVCSRYGSFSNIPADAKIQFTREESAEAIPYMAAILFDSAKDCLKQNDTGVYKMIMKEKGETETEVLVKESKLIRAFKKIFKYYI